MNASDLITQVQHSEDEENGHDAHIQHEDSHPSLWTKFLGCLLCKAKPPNKAGGHFKHQSALPLQQTNLSNANRQSNNIPLTAVNNQSALANIGVNKPLTHSPSMPMPLQAALPQPNQSQSLVMGGGVPPSKYLLPPLSKEDIMSNKKTLVLDLDETLVHSSFKPIINADFVLSIDLEGVIHRVYVRKRPGVDHFMRYCAEKFEVVIFTASLAKYADPLLDILDRDRTVKVRLFREACVQHYGNYVKDLTHLGRKLENTIIVDNSPFSYMFQPENAIPITSWFNDKNDRQLYDLLPHLDHMAESSDIIQTIAQKKLQFVNGQVIQGS